MEDKLYTTGEVARIFGLSPATIWRWCNLGTVKGVVMVGSVHKEQRLIPETEVKRLYKIVFKKELEV